MLLQISDQECSTGQIAVKDLVEYLSGYFSDGDSKFAKNMVNRTFFDFWGLGE